MATQNKNVRLGEGALEVLRALKYDLDASDGAIIEESLHTRAFERLREHVEELDRIERGLPAEGGAAEHATAAQVLLTALNRDGDGLRLSDGVLERHFQGDPADRWFPAGRSFPVGSLLLRACEEAAFEEVRDLGCFCVDLQEAALSLTRPGSPGRAVLAALSVDADALRDALLPLAARGDAPRDRAIPLGARTVEVMVETFAEAWRLGRSLRAYPEHRVLAVCRAARHDVLLALEAHAATYHLLRLRLTARPAMRPWSPAMVGALARAHILARQARRTDLFPNLLMLALAELGPEATPDVDNGALLAALRETEFCRPAESPLPGSLQVAIGWNLGSSIMVGEALRTGSQRAADAGRERIEPDDVYVGLCLAVERSPVKSDLSLQQTMAALEAAGYRVGTWAED